MPASVSEQIVDSITMTNAKSILDATPAAVQLSTQNAVSQQQTLNAIQNTALQGFVSLTHALFAKAAKSILDESAQDAVNNAKTIASDTQDKINNLGSAIASVQQDLKGAQSTPPESAVAAQINDLATTLAAVQAQLDSLKKTA